MNQDKEQIEESVRIGLRPTMGDRDTQLSVLANILQTELNWRAQGGVLYVENDDVEIRIQNSQPTFLWKK